MQHEPASSNRARRSLALTLLAYVSAIVLAITLSPFQLRSPELALTGFRGSFDLAVNVALFLPVGFFWGLGGFHRARPVRGAGFVGLCFSGVIEASQMFVVGRSTSPLDLATNTLGAAVGAWVFLRFQRTLRASLAERLALELPLMALFYLLVPLGWLTGLVALTQPNRCLMLFPLALFGAYLFGAVYHHRLKPAGALRVRGFLLLLVLWLGLAGLPGAVAHPFALLALAAFVTALGLVFALFPKLFQVPDRRFELPTLRRAGPAFGLFVLALALWPAPEVEPTGALGELSRLYVVEWSAAWSVFGFLLAELKGRSPRGTLGRWAELAATTAVALGAVLLARHLSGGPWRTPRAVLALGGAIAGAFIYRIQLAAVREMIGAPPSSRAPRSLEAEGR